ncbi:hypothetical protein BDV18DRAFT_163634 [Aspergillus unguis]
MDCYELLEISANASLKDINSAYKRLALKHHPDKTDGNDAAIKFQKINEAVEILRNPDTRAVHDKQLSHRNNPPSEEERLFASPEYTGWKPNGMYRGSYKFENKYMFSYGESVHMKPHSEESREELARCEKERVEEKERRENLYRAADISAEKEEWDMQFRRSWMCTFDPEADSFRDADQCEEELRSTSTGLNPGADHFREPKRGEKDVGVAYSPVEPVWWAGAEPQREQHGFSAADTGVDNDFLREYKFGHDVEAEVVEQGPARDTDARAAGPESEATPDESELGPRVPYEDGPDLIDLDFDDTTSTDGVKKGSWGESEAESNTNAKYDIDASTHMPQTPDKCFKRTMSGTWPDTPSESQNRAYAETTENADQESAPSIYYDFSDAASLPAKRDNNDALHDSYNEGFSNAVSSDVSSSPLWYDLADFNQSSIYPYLCPFIPYFTRKLADERSLYTKDDCYGELKGMVMETYCGWLEALRVTIPGAQESANACDPCACRHLGYWTKELGHEACKFWDNK